MLETFVITERSTLVVTHQQSACNFLPNVNCSMIFHDFEVIQGGAYHSSLQWSCTDFFLFVNADLQSRVLEKTKIMATYAQQNYFVKNGVQIIMLKATEIVHNVHNVHVSQSRACATT